MEALKVGTPAREFELNATPDQRVRLSDFRGQRVILAFSPADWSPVCGDQLALYNELRDEFAKHKAICIGVSVDARDYNVCRAKVGVSERGLFVLDEEGVIRWNYVSPIGINPGADGILNALEKMDGRTS